MKLLHLSLSALVALSLLASAGCGPLLRNVLGQPEPQTSVSVSCADPEAEGAPDATPPE